MYSWRLIESEALLENRWLTISKNHYEKPNGERVIDYFVLSRKDFVLVVAMEQNGIILIKQYRPATNKSYYSLPAGYLEEGESPIDAAQREIIEETGRSGINFRIVGSLDPLPGYIRSKAHIVTCDLTFDLQPLHQNDEDIFEVITHTWDSILKMIITGEIDEMQAVAALLLVKQTL